MQSSDFNNEKNTMKIDQKLKRKTNLEEFINSEATVKSKCCLINEQWNSITIYKGNKQYW